MCPTQKMMEERSCAGQCRINPQFTKTVLWSAGIVVFFAALQFWIHLLIGILIGTGALTIGAVAAYVKWVVPWRRRQVQQLTTGWSQAQAAAMHQSAAQQLPANQPAQVHHHHGNVLSLPGVNGDDLLRALRREQ